MFPKIIGVEKMKDAQIAIPTEDGRIYYDMAGTDNPCNGCSACCRHFRVSFYHGEMDTQPGGHVPADMTAQLTPFRACMKGCLLYTSPSPRD